MGYELLEIEMVFDDLAERIEKTKSSLNNEFKSMRAGRANAHILDKVLVPYYGVDTPINQMSSAEAIGIHTLYLLIFADLAILKVGAAIKATTAGRIPLKIFSTTSYSLNC